MRIHIVEDYSKVSLYAANYLKIRLKKFNPTPERKFVLGKIQSSLIEWIERRRIFSSIQIYFLAN